MAKKNDKKINIYKIINTIIFVLFIIIFDLGVMSFNIGFMSHNETFLDYSSMTKKEILEKYDIEDHLKKLDEEVVMNEEVLNNTKLGSRDYTFQKEYNDRYENNTLYIAMYSYNVAKNTTNTYMFLGVINIITIAGYILYCIIKKEQ